MAGPAKKRRAWNPTTPAREGRVPPGRAPKSRSPAELKTEIRAKNSIELPFGSGDGTGSAPSRSGTGVVDAMQKLSHTCGGFYFLRLQKPSYGRHSRKHVETRSGVVEISFSKVSCSWSCTTDTYFENKAMCQSCPMNCPEVCLFYRWNAYFFLICGLLWAYDCTV